MHPAHAPDVTAPRSPTTRALAAGLYLVRVETGDAVLTARVKLLR